VGTQWWWFQACVVVGMTHGKGKRFPNQIAAALIQIRFFIRKKKLGVTCDSLCINKALSLVFSSIFPLRVCRFCRKFLDSSEKVISISKKNMN